MLQRVRNGSDVRLAVVAEEDAQEARDTRDAQETREARNDGQPRTVPPTSEVVEGRAAPGAPHAAAAPQAHAARRTGRWLLMGGLAAAALTAGTWFGYDYVTVGRFMVSTDDAYVAADTTTLAAKVPGYLSEILVGDNARVRAGDLIARIDDGDYRIALESARAKAATQQGTIERIGRQIAAQNAAVEQAKAQVASAQAAQRRMQSEYERQQALAGRDFASRQTLEQALANRDQANASVRSARAALDGAVASVAVLQAQRKEAALTLDELKTAVAKAERDLSFTEIRAPVDGVIGNRALQAGDFVQTGQRIAAIVPLSDVYIDANFKETQLAHLQPGQPVSVAVDALPDDRIEGVVASLSPASGAVFSLLPPDNATGNFTKIVQRIGVRIQVPAAVAERGRLRPGMSVVVSVDTKPDAVAAIRPRFRTATAAN